MEGLVDALMRETLTAVGGIDWCVTEFIRVTNSLLPNKCFYRYAPELLTGSVTKSGTPVRVQLLGSDAICLADNAAKVASLGAPVIDLNFGCPAPTVNRHRGGAVLLQEPEFLYALVSAVRAAVPASIPVTAKMRLGYMNTDLALDCARALAAGGASSLVVHARTKAQGYQPPAFWAWIADIRAAVTVPVMANGEIWTVTDFWQCIEESGDQDAKLARIMLGRGLVAQPDLAWVLRAAVGLGEWQTRTWADWASLLLDYWFAVQGVVGEASAHGRLKLWLGYLRRTYPEAFDLQQIVRTEKSVPVITQHLRASF